jgi:outer membrane protein assembly factor BamB
MRRRSTRTIGVVVAGLIWTFCVAPVRADPGRSPADWSQFAQSSTHRATSRAAGQPIDQALADVVIDPFVAAGIGLPIHYQVPLLRGDDMFIEIKSGSHSHQVWSERRLRFERGVLVQKWTFASDWQPVPIPISSFQPLFHAALVGDAVFVPGLGGTVFAVSASTGEVQARLNPFGPQIDPSVFVVSPLTVSPAGDVYYDTIRVNPDRSSAGSWIVRIDRHGRIRTASIPDLVPDPPTTCVTQFALAQLPWPPARDAVPPLAPCGPQRTGIDTTPAVAPDGTVYTVSRADRNGSYGYLLALRPDLTLEWAASLRGHLADGCGVLVPIAPTDTPGRNQCRFGTVPGVDPATNMAPAGVVLDGSTSSPVVMPDGDVLYGTSTAYNRQRGHLMQFTRHGRFIASFDFGFDSTAAIWVGRDGRPHVVTKDNHYNLSYCFPRRQVPISQVVCGAVASTSGPFFITQLDEHLVPEWKFQNINTQFCLRQSDGSVSCQDGGDFFEWCVNVPAVDRNGVVYANSEDGNLYAIGQGHRGVFSGPSQRLFLDAAIPGAYTPLSISEEGLIFTQNDGHLVVAGRLDAAAVG